MLANILFVINITFSTLDKLLTLVIVDQIENNEKGMEACFKHFKEVWF